MQPGVTELLTGIKNIIFNTLVPELQTPQARQEAMYSTILIEHLIARWEIEGALLIEEHNELRTLLTQALEVLGEDASLREALDAASTMPPSPRALDAQNERMRSQVPAIARKLPPTNEPRVLELDAAVRAYIRDQHRRDRQIVQVGELAW